MADSKGKSSDDGKGTLIAIGVMVGVLVLVPALLGYLVFAAARRLLDKRENWVLLGGGIALSAWKSSFIFGEYGRWLVTIASGHFTLGSIPWVPLLVLAGTFAGLFGLLAGTRAVEKFGRVLRPSGLTVGGKSGKSGKGIKAFGSGSAAALLPDLEERKKAHARTALAAPPGTSLTVSSSAHSVLDSGKPGQRSFPIGRALDGTPVTLSESEIGTHGVILGATGSGKTETIKALMGALLDLGWSGTLIDLKEDTAAGGLREFCFDYSTAHSTPFQELCLSNPNSATWFNPLAGMGPDEMRDTVLSLNEFEAAYYEALNKELLGQLVMLMTWAHQVDPTRFPEPSMYDIAKICRHPKGLPEATRAMRAVVQQSIPGITADDFTVLAAPSKAQQESAVGFGSRLGNLYDSQAGRIVLRPGMGPTGSERQMLDITRPGLTYVGLDSQGKQDLTRVISSALLQRMSVYAAQRTTGVADKGAPRFVIIDEANWINRDISQNLLSRARGAGLSMWFCTQGPKDWIDKRGDDWGKLTNNINVAIIMRQGEPESATLSAEHIGKEMKTTVSEKVTQTRGALGAKRVRDDDGRLVESFNVMETLDYKVSPDELRNLTVGEAMLRVGNPAGRLEYVRISQRDPQASPLR